MARVVVVASAELDREALGDVLAPDDELHVVVPVVEQSRLQWLTNDEDAARAEAERVGEEIGRAAPADASSIEVKPDPPSQLVLDAIAEHNPDRVIVALREGDDASWLEDGELGQLRTEIQGVPITRVTL